MNSLLYLLVAISAMSSQLSTRPFCNGPGCQSNQPSAATWSQSSNRTMESRRSSLLVDRRDSVKCPCRTCDPRFPCSPENCGRQDCPDCVNACQNCSPDQSASQVNDGWEPRRTDLRGRKPFSQTSVQRICPVTGEELGSMGRPIPVKVSGRTIQVCCQACVTEVQRNPEKYLRRVIDEIGAGPFDVSGQPPNPRQSYLQPNPQRLCPVTGEELGSMGSPIPVTVSGRTIHVCCEACVASVKKNPAKYFAKVAQELKPFSNREEMSRTDSFTPRDQAPPQQLCPVTGEELGSMGPPIPVTVSGRTIQVCCEACVAAVKRDPAKYFGIVPRERSFIPTRPASGRLMPDGVLR